MRTKYKAQKGNGFDSKLEEKVFTLLKLNSCLSGPVRAESVIVFDRQIVTTTKTKTGKSVIQAIKYTPDFKFTTRSEWMGIPAGKRCYLEVKSKGTKTARDYSLRRRLFIYKCTLEGWVFVEWIDGQVIAFNL